MTDTPRFNGIRLPLADAGGTAFAVCSQGDAVTPPGEDRLDTTYAEYFCNDDDEQVTRERNPDDPRLGNLAGTPKPTSFKKNTSKKYRRRTFTERDELLLAFLARFKFSNSTQLAHLAGVQPKSTHKRLLGLREAGLVASHRDVFGVKLPWFITQRGLSLLATTKSFDPAAMRRVTAQDVETSQFGHFLAVNQVAIQLLIGWNPLRSEDEKECASIDQLVSEYQITSSWWSWRDGTESEHSQLDGRARNWKRDDFAAKGRTLALSERAGLLTVVPKLSQPGSVSTYHFPDLVLLQNDGSVAVEIETSIKTIGDYERIINTFLRDDHRTFDKLVWVCNSKSAAARVDQAAENLGLLDDSFCKVVPLMGWNGAPFSERAWRL
ncbi:replication-relaxation family protein [Nocardioides sambongensis]|uniref:replication-relaxation family protein n=1 Tax=Nocardioides sambongensis TaxID=2589074 RepID=UPI00112E9F86|nr:replication-relaxation family protein [Nocardioides sambongensis]